MQFPIFEHLKKIAKDYRQQRGTATGFLRETALIMAMNAGSAGSVAAVITTLVDVVKTRIMLSAAGNGSNADAMKEVERARAKGQSGSSLATEKGVTKESGYTVARQVIRESGVKGLFRGGSLRSTWTALGSGLYLSVYESGRHFLGDYRKVADPYDGLERHSIK